MSIYNLYGVETHKSNKGIIETHFPYNIYEADIVHELPYFTRDIINPETHFEYTRNVIPQNPHPYIPGRWGWGHFPNGYGTGNFIHHNNCPKECEPEPKGYVSAKTQIFVDLHKQGKI